MSFISNKDVVLNEEKTKELIQNLKDNGGVDGIEDLSRYIRSKGLIVKEHVGRKRNFVEVTPEVFGINIKEKDDDFKDFFKQHVKMGRLSFIPDSYEKELGNVESSLRMTRRRATIGLDSTFMTLESYEEFQKEFDKHKKLYFEIQAEILEKWDTLMDAFSQSLKGALDELGSIQKEVYYQTVMRKVPSKKEYEASFYIRKTVKAFPIVENLDMFDAHVQTEVQESINSESVAMMYEIIGSVLNEGFEQVSKILKQALNKGPENRTLGAARATSKRMGKKNIFGNEKIDDIRESIYELTNMKGQDELVEESEAILASIYTYAEELGLGAMINLKSSPLQDQDLIAIAG